MQLKDRGSRLLASLERKDVALRDVGNPMREVALSACLTADRLERLEELAAECDPWVTTDKGALITHPVLIEVRQQATLFARLVAALRVPDPKTGKRPQTRPGRGVHAPAKLTSLDRARERAEGVG